MIDKLKSLFALKNLKKSVLLSLSCLFVIGNFSNVIASTELKAVKEKLYISNKKEEKPLEVLLLLALPAAGKSEIRNYLTNLSDEKRLEEFNVGKMVQLDDFPYVFFMRRISEELDKRGVDPIFYQSKALPLTDPRDWKMLIKLINEDYEDIINKKEIEEDSASLWLFDRLDGAAIKIGKEPALSELDKDIREEIAKVLEDEAKIILNNKIAEITKANGNNTVVIEFARGGALTSSMPLPTPYGYENSLNELSETILNRAKILYVDVTPQESRIRNEKRFDKNNPSSILNHKVPITVMYKDYGTDDMKWLLQVSDKPNTIKINGKKEHYIPTYVLDNTRDKTSFARASKNSWSTNEMDTFHKSLKNSLKEVKK